VSVHVVQCLSCNAGVCRTAMHYSVSYSHDSHYCVCRTVTTVFSSVFVVQCAVH
jgi:hypothetical protein